MTTPTSVTPPYRLNVAVLALAPGPVQPMPATYLQIELELSTEAADVTPVVKDLASGTRYSRVFGGPTGVPGLLADLPPQPETLSLIFTRT